jgi:hypothetical protein
MRPAAAASRHNWSLKNLDPGRSARRTRVGALHRPVPLEDTEHFPVRRPGRWVTFKPVVALHLGGPILVPPMLLVLGKPRLLQGVSAPLTDRRHYVLRLSVVGP